MRLFHFLSELKRRRVYRVAAAYVVGGFTLLEAADLILPALSAPPWIYRTLVLVLLGGFPVVLGLSWAFDLTPEGLERDRSAGDGAGVEIAVRRPATGFWVATALVGLVGVGAWFAGRSSARPPATDLSSGLAVLPFSPAVPDSALERRGRELVVTLSYALSATGEIETVEPLSVLSSVPPERGPLTLQEAGERAANLGAGTLLHGGLVRTGDRIRLDVSLHETGTLRRLGSESVSAERVDALTDSATLAVLRLTWRESPGAPPSPGAISTGSVEALQAYLAGERAVAEGRWREAPEAFARAVAADSTFWFAYWRLAYALDYHGSPVDSVVRARVWEHRHELPERDRLLVEARRAEVGEQLRLLRDLTTRSPSYWPAWWHLGDLLSHNGGFLGRTLSDTRAALERTLELNPRFVPAWSHLFWVTTKFRDPEAMGRILTELSDARYDETTLRQAGVNSLALYRAVHALVASDGGVPDAVIRRGVGEMVSYRGPLEPDRIALGLLGYGFVGPQIRLSREVLRRGTAPAPMERAHRHVLAHAHAARESWDPALEAADAYAASASRPVDLLLPYRIAVVGAWSGGLDADRAEARRPDPRWSGDGRSALAAERAWLDGLLALSEESPAALARAVDGVREADTRWRDVLIRSLEAFRAGLLVGTDSGGRALESLEREMAARGTHFAYGSAHPFLVGVHRLVGSRWLLEHGDTLAARRLLSWYEAELPGTLYRFTLANQVLATPAIRLRAALARAAGRREDAAALSALARERTAPVDAPTADGGGG